ncbi:MAG TPA: histidine kinase, partial [Gemmatimonadaceae bacterium]|nr:histidine kinase [Gemmatimonadaceae bacterium]
MSSWAILGLWTIPALLSALETVVFARMTGHPISPVRAFIAEAPQWYGWALLTPVVAGLGERFPLRRPLRARVIVVHALASLSASLLVACADAVVNAAVRPSPGGVPTGIWNWFVSGLPVTTLVYFAIIGIAYALRSAARLREREQRAAHLEAELRQAQLGALRMQLQPHFLFNALNAVMALVRDQDTTRAVRALSLLSDVLRTTVNAGDALESTLGDEVEFVTRYLEIERIRFGERLTVAVRVPGDLKDALVPVFVLQPFVENALKHGILRGREGNEVVVSAAAHGGTLALVVRD